MRLVRPQGSFIRYSLHLCLLHQGTHWEFSLKTAIHFWFKKWVCTEPEVAIISLPVKSISWHFILQVNMYVCQNYTLVLFFKKPHYLFKNWNIRKAIKKTKTKRGRSGKESVRGQGGKEKVLEEEKDGNFIYMPGFILSARNIKMYQWSRSLSL
jgi:hypothetical protein